MRVEPNPFFSFDTRLLILLPDFSQAGSRFLSLCSRSSLTKMTGFYVRFFVSCVLVSLVAADEGLPERILDEYDQDADQKLNLEEFQGWYATTLGSKLPFPEKFEVHSEDETHPFNCTLPTELFTQFDTNNDSLLEIPEISNISVPLFTMQIAFCKIEAEASAELTCVISRGGAWGGAILSSIVVSLIALIAIIVLPLGRERVDKYVLFPLVAFAIGALLGDAILHLIPEILGAHSHEEEGGEAAHAHAHAHEAEVPQFLQHSVH
jgi:hypothetical protein